MIDYTDYYQFWGLMLHSNNPQWQFIIHEHNFIYYFIKKTQDVLHC